MTKAETRVFKVFINALGDARKKAHNVAVSYTGLRKKLGADRTREALRDHGFHANSLDKLDRMFVCVGLVSDPMHWRALGWPRINRLIAATKDKRVVGRILKDMMLQANEQGVITSPDERLSASLAKHKVTAKPVTGRRAHKCTTPIPVKPDTSALVEEVRALVEGQYPFLRDVLSIQALAVLGIKKAKRSA